ncbi:MAG: hypothetical protein J5750_04780, partial [Clostridiales bacterium]|nr:hypothetical protein [Clostridiales bacterium]
YRWCNRDHSGSGSEFLSQLRSGEGTSRFTFENMLTTASREALVPRGLAEEKEKTNEDFSYQLRKFFLQVPAL